VNTLSQTSFGAPDAARETSAGAAPEVARAITAMFQKFADHDPEGVEAALHENCTVWDLFVPELIVGREQRRKFHAADQAQAQARGPLDWSIEPPLIDVWGDTAIARYVLRFSYQPPNAVSGVVRITSVLRRQETGWLIVHHHEGLAPGGVPPVV
jgi:ketosteroid isomerase-like protein